MDIEKAGILCYNIKLRWTLVSSCNEKKFI